MGEHQETQCCRGLAYLGVSFAAWKIFLPLFLFIINASELRSLMPRNGSCCEIVSCSKVNNYHTGDEKVDVEDL